MNFGKEQRAAFVSQPELTYPNVLSLLHPQEVSLFGFDTPKYNGEHQGPHGTHSGEDSNALNVNVLDNVANCKSPRCLFKGDPFAYAIDTLGPDADPYETAEYLARNIPGLKMPDNIVISDAERKKQAREKDYYGIMNAAHQIYRQPLTPTDIDNPNDPAYALRQPLYDWGLDDEFIDAAGIGYAPNTTYQNYLQTELKKKKLYSSESAMAAGLCGIDYDNDTSKVIDKFNHRYMFPVFLSTGRPAYFIGRAVNNDTEPRYKYQPRKPTPLEHVPLLDSSTFMRSKHLGWVIPEGIRDFYLLARQFGREHRFVSFGGTNPSAGQYKEFAKKYISEAHIRGRKNANPHITYERIPITIFLDADEAGRIASIKIAEGILDAIKQALIDEQIELCEKVRGKPIDDSDIPADISEAIEICESMLEEDDTSTDETAMKADEEDEDPREAARKEALRIFASLRPDIKIALLPAIPGKEGADVADYFHYHYIADQDCISKIAECLDLAISLERYKTYRTPKEHIDYAHRGNFCFDGDDFRVEWLLYIIKAEGGHYRTEGGELKRYENGRYIDDNEDIKQRARKLLGYQADPKYQDKVEKQMKDSVRDDSVKFNSPLRTNVKNGMISWDMVRRAEETGSFDEFKLLEHSPFYDSTLQAHFNFIADFDELEKGLSPWHAILLRLMASGLDAELVKEILGLYLHHSAELEKFPFFKGPERCGKGTVFYGYETVLGEENITTYSVEQIEEGDFITQDLATVFGNIGYEEDDKKTFRSRMIKLIAVGEGYQGRQMYQKQRLLKSTGTLGFAGEEFNIGNASKGLIARILTAAFTGTIPAHERINKGKMKKVLDDLRDYIGTEAMLCYGGVLNRNEKREALLAQKKPIPEDLQSPWSISEESKDLLLEFENTTEPAGEFLSSCVKKEEGGFIQAKRLYDIYYSYTHGKRRKGKQEFFKYCNEELGADHKKRKKIEGKDQTGYKGFALTQYGLDYEEQEQLQFTPDVLQTGSASDQGSEVAKEVGL